MTWFARSFIGLLLALATLSVSGCAQIAGSPEQAAKEFFSALVDERYDDAWNLLSEAQRDKLNDELKSLSSEDSAKDVARLRDMLGIELTPGKLGSMGGKEYFIAALRGARANDPEFKRMLAGAPKVDAQTASGPETTAQVKVTFADGRSRLYTCVKESGAWRISISP